MMNIMLVFTVLIKLYMEKDSKTKLIEEKKK